MSRVDVAIIGSGPAGVSAAITLKIRGKNILLIGSKELSPKMSKAAKIQNYPGFPDITGADLVSRFKEHIASLNIEVTEDKITSVYAMGDYFTLQGASSTMYEANSVILATGVTAAKPYPGEEEFLGRGVSYCATCDAPLCKGKTVAVIGSSHDEEAEGRFLTEVADKVYYIPTYKDEVENAGSMEVIKDAPVSISRDDNKVKLNLKESSLDVDSVFILRESVLASQLVPGLLMDGNTIKVSRDMSTNIPGLFACGDIVGFPYQYIKSAGEGNIAALSVVKYLGGKQNG